ncbi:MAG: DNA-directed RNA polymerase subunit beta', partial [Clostridia bacterium]
KEYSARIDTTIGRMIFNNIIPQNLGLVKRETPEQRTLPEFNALAGKKDIANIIQVCFDNLGTTETAKLLDRIKDTGYKFSTLSGLTTSLFDMRDVKQKDEFIGDANAAAIETEKQYKRGFITADEKSNKLQTIWKDCMTKFENNIMVGYEAGNPLRIMVDSKARGNVGQMAQLTGIIGLMATTSGSIIEVPIRSSYKDGLSMIEYFIQTRGGRKGMVDKALKTADAGYLTRRLVDVAQDVIVKEEDCFEALGEKVKGMEITPIYDGTVIVESLSSRIAGRYSAEDIKHPVTGEIIIPSNTFITTAKAKEIEKSGLEKVIIRSVFTCKTTNGVCAKCYGRDMASNSTIQVGEAVGIIAAQSIGEPGTQLTMKVFQSGGSATADDITAGLPRVEEILEARKPKGVATISEIAGKVEHIDEAKGQVTIKGNDSVEIVYACNVNYKYKVKVGDMVEPGTPLNDGSLNPTDILKTRGVKGVQDYMMREILKVYKNGGTDVNDKHLEIIIRQMLRKVKVEDAGDTNILPGELVDIYKYEIENERVLAEGKEPATAKRVLLSITKAALATDSFLSAASFQETVRVLTDAAVKNKIDPLVGLKENVIIGKLIPAGTGLLKYRELVPKSKLSDEVMEVTDATVVED